MLVILLLELADENTTNMKQLLNVFLFVTMLLGLSACEKEDKDMFIVEGERNFSITKEGDMISVILRTTQITESLLKTIGVLFLPNNLSDLRYRSMKTQR